MTLPSTPPKSPFRVKDWAYINAILALYAIYAFIFRRTLIISSDVWSEASNFNDYFLIPWSEFVHVDSRFYTTTVIWVFVALFVLVAAFLYIFYRYKMITSIKIVLLVQMLSTFAYLMILLWGWRERQLDTMSTTWQPFVFIPLLLAWIIIPALLIFKAPFLKSSA